MSQTAARPSKLRDSTPGRSDWPKTARTPVCVTLAQSIDGEVNAHALALGCFTPGDVMTVNVTNTGLDSFWLRVGPAEVLGGHAQPSVVGALDGEIEIDGQLVTSAALTDLTTYPDHFEVAPGCTLPVTVRVILEEGADPRLAARGAMVGVGLVAERDPR